MDKKISQLTGATTPLTGTEELAIVQGGVTKKVAASDLGGGGIDVESILRVLDATPNGFLPDTMFNLFRGNNTYLLGGQDTSLNVIKLSDGSYLVLRAAAVAVPA